MHLKKDRQNSGKRVNSVVIIAIAAAVILIICIAFITISRRPEETKVEPVIERAQTISTKSSGTISDNSGESPSILTSEEQTSDDQSSENSPLKKEDSGAKESLPVSEFEQRSRTLAVFLDIVDYTIDDSSASAIESVKPVGDNSYLHPRPFTLEFSKDGIWHLEMESDPSICRDEEVMAGSYSVYNLIPNEIYYWSLHDVNGNLIQEGRLKAKGNTRVINLEKIVNVRDLGGWKTSDGGTIRYNVLFRGGPLEGATDYDRRELEVIGLDCELDLRSNDEAWNKTSSGIEGVEYARIAVNNYDGAVNLDKSSAKTTKEALEYIIDAVLEGKQVYFHCAAGADRTGTIAALIEGLLGVSQEDMDKDYELTSFGYTMNNRLRSNAYYQNMVRYMNEMAGNTLQEKYEYWFLAVGFEQETIDEFKEFMVVR